MTMRARVMMIAILMALGLGASAVEARRPVKKPPAGRRCRTDRPCHGGQCNGSHRCCPAGDIKCGGQCCGAMRICCGDAACVDDLTDGANCGACGVVCTGGKTCQLGSCVCGPGKTECNGVCVDTESDGANCGACGHACDDGFRCVEGRCRCAGAGEMPCDGRCVDAMTDPSNCGVCGRACAAGESCIGGQCRAGCGPCEQRVGNQCVLAEPGKDFDCGGYCADLAGDPSNCGGCGLACPSGATCTHGVCDVCPARWVGCALGGEGGNARTSCCAPSTPTCCFGVHGGGCCSDDTNCCVTSAGTGYCCPADTQCCAGSSDYPCVPAGTPCP